MVIFLSSPSVAQDTSIARGVSSFLVKPSLGRQKGRFVASYSTGGS